MIRKQSNTEFNILTNDPSMTAWGWAVLDSTGKILNAGAIKTSPSDKRLKLRKGDDRIRRISEINSVLLGVIAKYHVRLILSEQPHGSQSAVAAVMIGMVTGMLQTMSDIMAIAIEWYSEGDCKMAMAGKRSLGSKDEMVRLVGKEFDVKWQGIKWIDQAVADALAVYNLATIQSEILKFAKQ